VSEGAGQEKWRTHSLLQSLYGVLIKEGALLEGVYSTAHLECLESAQSVTKRKLAILRNLWEPASASEHVQFKLLYVNGEVQGSLNELTPTLNDILASGQKKPLTLPLSHTTSLAPAA
jgi:hypothetical protein